MTGKWGLFPQWLLPQRVPTVVGIVRSHTPWKSEALAASKEAYKRGMETRKLKIPKL